jgi:hypothetical protein
MVPHYDTGAWSLYDQFEESNLSYHELLTEFLNHLCQRTRKGPPFIETPAAGTQTTTGASGATGGSSGGPSSTAPTAPAIAGDAIYCTTARHFEADLTTPPAIALVTTTLPTSSRAGVRMSLSKISTVHLVVRRGGRIVWSNSATLSRGRPRLLWITPSRPGNYEITLTATDLAGNFQTAHGTVHLARGAKGN